MSDEILNLLGMRFDEATTHPLILRFGVKPKKEKVVDRHYLTLKTVGLSFDGDQDKCVRAIFLRAEGHEASAGYKGYQGCLPREISFSDSRKTIKKKLGTPSASGEKQDVPVLGLLPSWDRFDLGRDSLSVEYADDEESVMCGTVMSPNAVPK